MKRNQFLKTFGLLLATPLAGIKAISSLQDKRHSEILENKKTEMVNRFSTIKNNYYVGVDPYKDNEGKVFVFKDGLFWIHPEELRAYNQWEKERILKFRTSYNSSIFWSKKNIIRK